MNIMEGNTAPKKQATGPNETGINTAQGVAGLVGGILAMIPTPYTKIAGTAITAVNNTVTAGRKASKEGAGAGLINLLSGGSDAINMVNSIKGVAAKAPVASNPVDTSQASNPMYRQGLEMPSAVPDAMPTIQPYSPTVRLPMPKLSQGATSSFQFYQGGR